MAIGLINFPNITAPDSDYPSGRIKDDTGAEDGTPIDLLTNGDIQEFPDKLMRLTGVTPSGIPENEYSGHQYIEALWKFGNINFVTDIIKGLIGSYTTNDLIILWGCTITANIGGTSSITQGAIYYNGLIYKVSGASIPSPSNTLVFKISGVDIQSIVLVNAGPGTGIANYNSSTVKLKSLPNNFIKASQTANTAAITTSESTILALVPSATQSSNKISITFSMNWQSSSSGDDIYFFTVKKNGVAIQGVLPQSTTAGFKHQHTSIYETSYTKGDLITVTVYTQNYTSSLNYAIVKAESSDCNF